MVFLPSYLVDILKLLKTTVLLLKAFCFRIVVLQYVLNKKYFFFSRARQLRIILL